MLNMMHQKFDNNNKKCVRTQAWMTKFGNADVM